MHMHMYMYVLLAYWDKRERGLCSLGPYARRESSEASFARRSRMARFTPFTEATLLKISLSRSDGDAFRVV